MSSSRWQEIVDGAGRRLKVVPAMAVIGLIYFYQRWLSPVKFLVFGPGAGCRFYPSCSQYARESILTHGLFRGGWLAMVRLLKCHPFHPGGVDLTPPKRVGRCAECADTGRNSPNG